MIFVVFRLWSELTSWKKRLSFTLWGHIQLEDMFVYILEDSETFCVPDWTYTVFQVLNKKKTYIETQKRPRRHRCYIVSLLSLHLLLIIIHGLVF